MRDPRFSCFPHSLATTSPQSCVQPSHFHWRDRAKLWLQDSSPQSSIWLRAGKESGASLTFSAIFRSIRGPKPRDSCQPPRPGLQSVPTAIPCCLSPATPLAPASGQAWAFWPGLKRQSSSEKIPAPCETNPVRSSFCYLSNSHGPHRFAAPTTTGRFWPSDLPLMQVRAVPG